jgi:hypothetical protein
MPGGGAYWQMNFHLQENVVLIHLSEIRVLPSAPAHQEIYRACLDAGAKQKAV